MTSCRHTGEIALADLTYRPNSSTSPSTSLPTSGAATPLHGKEDALTRLTEAELVDQTLYLPSSRVVLIVFSLGLTWMIGVMELTVLGTALPSIASYFHAGQQTSWIINSYLIGSVAVSPFYGRFCDIWSRKAVLLSAMAFFFVGTLGCTFSSSLGQLIAFRALQGIRSTGFNCAAFIIIADIVPLKQRGKYQGIIDSICSGMQAAGPLLGSALTTALNWRATFWVMLPVIGLVIVLQVILIPAKRMRGNWKAKLASVDYMGTLLCLASLVLLLVGLSRGGVETRWYGPSSIVCFALSAATLASFVLWELKAASLPVVQIRLFKMPTVISVHLTTMFSMMSQFIIIFYIPQFLQVVRGMSLIESGLAIIPYGVLLSIFVCASIVSAKWISLRVTINVGFALFSVFSGLLVRINEKTSFGSIAGLLAFGGVGGGLCLVTPLLYLQAAVPRQHMAVVTGSRTSVKLFGSALGTAIAGLVINDIMQKKLQLLNLAPDTIQQILSTPNVIQHSLKTSLDAGTYDGIISAYVYAYRTVFWLCLACNTFSFLASILLLRHHEIVRADDEQQKEAARLWLKENRKQHGEEADL